MDESAHGEVDAKPSRMAPLRAPFFQRYVAGFGLSLLGDQIWFVSLAWAAAALPTSGQTALVLAAGSIPRAILLILGGALADRHGALRVALTSQLARTAIMAAGAGLLYAVGNGHLWPLLVLAIVFGSVDAAHMPAAAALPPLLLPGKDLPAGQGIVQTLQRAALVAGAPIGGVIIAIGGLPAAGLVNAALFAAAWTVLRGLRVRTAHNLRFTAGNGSRQKAWDAIAGGLRYVAHDHVLGAVLTVITLLNIGLAGPLNVGIALLITAHGWSATTYGAILAVFAVGAAAGSLFVAAQRDHHAPVAVALRWVFVGSITLALVPYAPTSVMVMATVAVVGFSLGPGSALLMGLIQSRTPIDRQGRVMALVNFSALGLAPISYLVFGQLVGVASLPAVFTGFALLVVLTAVVAYFLPGLRSTQLHSC